MAPPLYHLIKAFRASPLAHAPSWEAPCLSFQAVNIFIMLLKSSLFSAMQITLEMWKCYCFWREAWELTINVLISLLCLTKVNVIRELCTANWIPQPLSRLCLWERCDSLRGQCRDSQASLFLSTLRVKAAAKYWQENKSLHLSPPPKVRIARSIFFLFYMKHRKNTSETFSDRNRHTHAKHQAGIFKNLILKDQTPPKRRNKQSVSSLRASWSPAFSYSFRIAAGSKCQDWLTVLRYS